MTYHLTTLKRESRSVSHYYWERSEVLLLLSLQLSLRLFNAVPIRQSATETNSLIVPCLTKNNVSCLDHIITFYQLLRLSLFSLFNVNTPRRITRFCLLLYLAFANSNYFVHTNLLNATSNFNAVSSPF